MTDPKPRIAIIPGDPSGIGPELIARLLNEDGVRTAAEILLIGDAHVWQQGAEQAGLPLDLIETGETEIGSQEGLAWLPMQTITPDDVRIAEVTQAGGRCSLRCLDKALDLALANKVDGVLFGPFNKAALTSAGLDAEDEHRYMARYIGFDGYHSEINVLGDLMTTRVTSHIGLRDVAERITTEAVEKAIGLAEDTCRRAGKQRPHIAVAALNPHAGDNGKFGREEIDILQPVIDAAQASQKHVTGPWPSDTVFLKAKQGEVDAIVTWEPFESVPVIEGYGYFAKNLEYSQSKAVGAELGMLVATKDAVDTKRDAVERFVEEAAAELTQLEHWGCPWSREPDGRVAVPSPDVMIFPLRGRG